MRISVAIMAHPARENEAVLLKAKLLFIPFSEVGIVYATKFDGTPHEREWDTGKRSLQYGVGKGDWHLVLQDDAILTPFFYENVTAAIEALPIKTLMSLYVGQARPWPLKIINAVEQAKDGDWLRHMMLLWGVGIAIPSDHIEPMLEYVAEWTEPYDTRIGIFYQQNMLPVYYTMPSLVDHGDNGKSLLEGHGILPGDRIAHRPATEKVTYTGVVIDM